jgi:hypothetical protein
MPTYKLPPTYEFQPSDVTTLKVAFVEARAREFMEPVQPRHSVWAVMSNAITEVLYVRGMDHQIVKALLTEWNTIARLRAQAAREAKQREDDQAR